MRLEILGNMGGSSYGCYTMSSLIDEGILLDVGTGVQNLSLTAMEKIKNVLLTHSHLDHTAMLAFLVDCQIGKNPGLVVHCLQETADSIRKGIFQSDIWFNMEELFIDGKPIIRFNIIKPYEIVEINGRRFTPFPVKHAVPTLGYCLHGERENFVFIADMVGAEDKVWHYLGKLDNFNQLVIEVSYPDSMHQLSLDSFHLTPQTLEQYLKKLPSHLQVYYCHAKPRYADRIAEEISNRFKGRVLPLECGQVFTF